MKVALLARRAFGFVLLSLIFSASVTRAAMLSGQVTDENHAPALNVQVAIPDLGRGAQTDTSGAYKIEGLPAGIYTVQFRRASYSPVTRRADVSKGDAVLSVQLSGSPLSLAPITITAAPEAKSTLDTPASVSVVEGRQLDRHRNQSVIGSIQNQPGVNMIDEGSTVVQPVTRGLNSQEVVVVEDGIRSEALQWGNEHAPEIDPLGVNRIEVMRGPNSLLYGSDALGGVIAINHPDLPNAHLGDGPLMGRFSSLINSNSNAVGENGEVSGASGDWGYRANLSQLQAGNFRTPDRGYIPNTGMQQISGDGAFGVRKEWGGVDFGFGKFNKHVELQQPANPPVFDDLEYQTLQHDHGKYHPTTIPAPATLDVTLGYDWVNRREFDSPTAPTSNPHLQWTQGTYSGDVKARLAPMGLFQGTLGVSGLRRIEQSLGAVHITPGYNENGVGEYLVEDIPMGKLDFMMGVRGDQNEYHINGDNLIGIDPGRSLNNPHPVAAQTLKYSAVTGAVGGVYHITEPLAFAVNVGRGYRNPVPFELFGFGVHEGGGEFLIGNPNLSPETSFNTDASIRWASPRIKAEVGVFRNYIHNYIFGAFNGQNFNSTTGVIGATGDLPVVTGTQGNATVKGVDGSVTVAPLDWLTLNTVVNMVRGFNNNGSPSDNTNYLPRVPADNMLVGADFYVKSLSAFKNPYIGVNERLTAAQKRTNKTEIPTGSYALTDLHAGTEFLVNNNRVALDAGVNNLFDKGYFDYNSILKQFGIQNPSKNHYVKVSVPFGS